MFQGSSSLSLDAKGRLTVPAKHRDALQVQSEGRLTLTRHPDGCLLMFPRQAWEAFRDKVSALPISARPWQRIFLGSASDVEMDSAGRILVPPELRQAAALDKQVMLMGMGSHFEVWDAASLTAHDKAAIEAGMPESLANFSF